MKNTTITLNDKGIMAVVGLVLMLTLALGTMVGFKTKEQKYESETQHRTYEQAMLISNMQEKADAEGTGDVVYGRFDESGNLWIYTINVNTGDQTAMMAPRAISD